jgi:hypothetical protein
LLGLLRSGCFAWVALLGPGSSSLCFSRGLINPIDETFSIFLNLPLLQPPKKDRLSPVVKKLFYCSR